MRTRRPFVLRPSQQSSRDVNPRPATTPRGPAATCADATGSWRPGERPGAGSPPGAGRSAVHRDIFRVDTRPSQWQRWQNQKRRLTACMLLPANATRGKSGRRLPRCDTVTDAYLSAHRWSHMPRRSLSSHEPTTDVSAVSYPSKGVTCRRFFEVCRYRWRRRPLSDSSSWWGPRLPPTPRRVVPPRQTSTLPPRSRRCPRLSRSCSRRLGAGPVTRMTRRRCRGWVR